MIITFILTILGNFLLGVVNLLPASSGLPSGILDAFHYAIYQISQWTFIFPISTVLTILGYTVLIELALWTFHGSVWFYNKARGI
jgi:hypothetical protein